MKHFGNLIHSLRKSYWLKSGTLVLSTRLSLTIMGFITFLILIRYFDKDDFGNWVIYMTITSLIETVRIGFLKSPLMILNSEQEIKKKLLYTNSLIINLLLSASIVILVVTVVSIWNSFYEIGVIRNLFFLYCIKLIIISFSDHVDLIQETNLEFKGSFLDMFSRFFVFLCLVILSIFFNSDLTLISLVIFQIAGSIIGFILTFLIALLKDIEVFSTFRYCPSYIKRYFKLGKFTFGSSLISITSRNIDSWMLGILISPAAVAIYNPALRISNVFEIPSSTMASVLLPKLTKKIGIEGTRSIRLYYERSLTYILIFMIPIGVLVFIFSEDIIAILVGSGFEQSSNLLRVTIFFGFLVPFNRQFNIVMESVGKPKTSFIVMVVTLIISLSSHYIFIKLLDVRGAAYGSLLTYVVIFLLTQVYLNYSYGIRFWMSYLDVLPTVFKIPNKIKSILK